MVLRHAFDPVGQCVKAREQPAEIEILAVVGIVKVVGEVRTLAVLSIVVFGVWFINPELPACTCIE